MNQPNLSIEERLAVLEVQNCQLRTRVADMKSRVRLLSGLAIAAAVGGLAMLQSPSAVAQGSGGGNTTNIRLNALEAKTQFLTVSGTEMFITGANLNIRNGMATTGTTNGLGNLIVGYNGSRGATGTDVRTGSHNIVAGDRNNYSSFGGLVVGLENVISGEYASVSGGNVNTASGVCSSVSGGGANSANGIFSSVSGGSGSSATEFCSSVSGGALNLASAAWSSVTGGLSNVANGEQSTVCGGSYNNASGHRASVSGGGSNVASGDWSSVSGGGSNTASANGSSVSGGSGITQSTPVGWSGGAYHTP